MIQAVIRKFRLIFMQIQEALMFTPFICFIKFANNIKRFWKPKAVPIMCVCIESNITNRKY